MLPALRAARLRGWSRTETRASRRSSGCAHHRAPTAPAVRARTRRTRAATAQRWRSASVDGGNDIRCGAPDAEARKNVLECKPMRRAIERRHRILGEHDRVIALPRIARCRLDAEVGRDAAEDDGGDAAASQLQVE